MCMTILKEINGTSEPPEHAKRPDARSHCQLRFVIVPSAFPVGLSSGRAPSHPSRRPIKNTVFSANNSALSRRGPVVEISTRMMKSRTSRSSGIPHRRQVHPGYFADQRAIGHPRDIVPRVLPSIAQSVGIRNSPSIQVKFTDSRRLILHAQIRCRENDLIITSLNPRRYFRPSRNNTRFPSSRADRRPTD